MPKREDRKLTPRENFLRMLKGEIPEWVPIYTYGVPMLEGEEIPVQLVTPLIVNDRYNQIVDESSFVTGVTDCWGVTWVGNYDTGNALIPKSDRYLLEDIEDWHDVVKAPDISDVDWEQMCKQTLEVFQVDPEQTAVGLYLYDGPFQQLMALMGFTEGLIAMIEEPEECAELLKYINDFYIEVGKKCAPYLGTDAIMMYDDTCSIKAPFISEELFTEICLPCYVDMAEALAKPYDIPIEFHNCGTAAHYIEICHEELGVCGWDPVQLVNDPVAFKEKWGREIAILGGWDATGELLDRDCPDEAIYESVRETYAKLAPDGGYAFCGSFLGPLDDERINHKNEILMKAAQECGDCFYD